MPSNYALFVCKFLVYFAMRGSSHNYAHQDGAIHQFLRMILNSDS
jgi:hypothetical protein